MKHKYVPLAEISNDTLKNFRFRDGIGLPDFKLPVTRHENLKRIDTDKDLQKSILLAICEVIVGTHMLHGIMPHDRQVLDIPNDFGCMGNFEVDFSNLKKVRILNLFGGGDKIQKWNYLK